MVTALISPGETNRAEIDAPRLWLHVELLVVAGVIASELLTVQLVAAVHGDRHVVLVLFERPRGVKIGGHPVGRDRARIEERHGTAVATSLRHGELEQIEGAGDVDVVGGDRRELGAGRKQRRQMVNAIDGVLGQDRVQQVAVEDRPRKGTRHSASQVIVERLQVDRGKLDGAFVRKPMDQSVTDLAGGTGYKNDRLTHARTRTSGRPSGQRAPGREDDRQQSDQREDCSWGFPVLRHRRFAADFGYVNKASLGKR